HEPTGQRLRIATPYPAPSGTWAGTGRRRRPPACPANAAANRCHRKPSASASSAVWSTRPLRACPLSTSWRARTSPGTSRTATARRSAGPPSPAKGSPCWRFDETTSTGRASALLEGESHGVHAVSVPGGGVRGVVEDVPQVGVAAGTPDLGADHAEGAVLDEGDGVGLRRGEEARPAAVGVELRRGAEQLRPAAAAAVDALAVLVEELARAGPLGPGLTQDVVLLRGEALAPLLVAQRHLGERHALVVGTHGSILRLPRPRSHVRRSAGRGPAACRRSG